MARGDTAPIYETDLRIDKHALDREFEKHPILHMQYAKLAAEADAAAKRAHEKVKTIRSEIYTTASRDGIPGIAKPTGPQIEAHYRTNTNYLEAKADMIEKEETARLLDSAMSAFRARRSSLENLAQLHFAGYFSSPKAPEGADYDEQVTNRADDKARKRMKK